MRSNSGSMSSSSLNGLLAGLDPEVRALARPHLTGVPDADKDIVGFYQATVEMKRRQQQQQQQH